jgi:hypothetical protein
MKYLIELLVIGAIIGGIFLYFYSWLVEIWFNFLSGINRHPWWAFLALIISLALLYLNGQLFITFVVVAAIVFLLIGHSNPKEDSLSNHIHKPGY